MYSIIIPAYNEGQRLALSLDKILRHASEQRWQAEIIVVDDGSTDDTAQLVSFYIRKNPTVRLLQNPGNRGKGYSVRHGMLEARGLTKRYGGLLAKHDGEIWLLVARNLVLLALVGVVLTAQARRVATVRPPMDVRAAHG